LNFHFSQFGPETEFSAYILEKEGQRLVHVQTMVQSFVADDDFFADKVEPDIAAGFRLIAHLHNHPFFFQNKSGDVAGTLVASGPDCRFFLSLMADHPGMKAIITNGFHSNEFSLEEVQRCDREKNRPAKGPWSKA
jgi:hypothetical protein